MFRIGDYVEWTNDVCNESVSTINSKPASKDL